MLVVAIDASRLTKEPAKSKVSWESYSKNGSLPGVATVGAASHEIVRAPCPLDTLGPRSPQTMCLAALESTLQRMS